MILVMFARERRLRVISLLIVSFLLVVLVALSILTAVVFLLLRELKLYLPKPPKANRGKRIDPERLFS
jgi:hypothetical protein